MVEWTYWNNDRNWDFFLLSCFSWRKCIFGALTSSDIDFCAGWVANLTMWVTWCDLGLGGLGRSPGPQSDPVGVKWCCPTEGGNQWAHPTASERDRGGVSSEATLVSGVTRARAGIKYTILFIIAHSYISSIHQPISVHCAQSTHSASGPCAVCERAERAARWEPIQPGWSWSTSSFFSAPSS